MWLSIVVGRFRETKFQISQGYPGIELALSQFEILFLVIQIMHKCATFFLRKKILSR